MRVKLNTASFEKQMLNIVNYSTGFIDGVKSGKKLFLNNLGKETIIILGQYVDASARSNPQALHHIYEWDKVGSPSARLFDIDYTVSNLGLSLAGTFKQSSSIKSGSYVPFYNKAYIMENGIPVTIKPKSSNVLVFESDGETVFTSKEVDVDNPGGNYVEGSFERVFDQFMLQYFKQSMLQASGIYNYISRPTSFKRNIGAGSRLGKSKGIETGFKWITNAKIGVE
jgi:hypothetical protein